MSLAQEKPRYEIPKPFPLTNNNDHSYLHKKFKKMASIMPANETKIEESVTNAKHRMSNLVGSISERTNYEAIKTNEDKIGLKEKDVQSNFKEYTNIYNVNMLKQRSVSTHKLEKTEKLDSDATRDVCAGNGRYVCTYCNLSCAKPSVLEKHIRAHTNERPYPCVPCGFAFKTKSNLYKHSRSRCHKLKTNGIESTSFNNEIEWSPESECDNVMSSEELRLPSIISQDPSSPDAFDDQISRSQSITSISCQSNEISKPKSIYKPKFHRAYKVEDDKLKKTFPPDADFLNEHISKIISENEAIVDVLETPLQKKYGKIKQMAENKNLENIDVRLNDFRSDAPLNLTKSHDIDTNNRKRCYSESFTTLEHQKLSQHPLNPERSIIKDLLLKTLVTGLLPVTSENYDGLDPLFVCSLCQISYRSAENLEIHTAYYCKGKPQFKDNGIKLSPVNFKETKVARADHILSRSNSIHVTLPEDPITPPLTNFNSSQTLDRLKPDNLIIVKPLDNLDVSTPLPSPGPLLGHTRLVDERRESRKSSESPRHQNEIELSKIVLSPKWKLEMRSENNFNHRSFDETFMRSDLYKPQNKLRCLEPTSLRFNDMNNQSIKPNQMFGGEVKILEPSVSNTTLRSEQIRTKTSNADELDSTNIIRSAFHAGGSTLHNIPKEESPDLKFSITPHIITPNLSVAALQKNKTSHFPFPPVGVITAYNPLTLPSLGHSMSPNGSTKIFHGGKMIPHVPGIPGPNTQQQSHNGQRGKDVNKQGKGFDFKNSHPLNGHIKPKILENNTLIVDRNVSKYAQSDLKQKSAQSDLQQKLDHEINKVQIKYALPTIKVANFDEQQNVNSHNATLKLESLKQEQSKFKFKPKSPRPESNFLVKCSTKNPDLNFENIISKSEIINTATTVSSSIKNEFKVSSLDNRPITSIVSSDRSETSYFQKNVSVKLSQEETKSKFLRPSSLPLKPGTFTPKKHHGITPNANTMPLISPETPRPAKAYGQLFLNGNAYTYLGLKCSTKVYYCTINRPQPTYVPNQHSLSMYSNWQICSDSTPHPLKLSTSEAMSLYDSRHRPQNYSISNIQSDRITTHSSQWKQTQDKNVQKTAAEDQKHHKEGKILGQLEPVSKGKDLAGGFESNEEYTYVRGRGRGRYVCAECGIRCKKPSMLKKHVRTHTDVRPYTCKHCTFSFKTKGNLTKHMKSKAHYKKCCELGISPTEGAETDTGESMQTNGDSDEETESDPDDANEAETESSDTDSLKSRLPEHEAAHCLLSLWGARAENTAPPGLISARPCTYPYVVGIDETLVTTPVGKNSDANRDHPEPMDLSKAEQKTTDIKPPKEHSILESLASNTAKLPQQTKEWIQEEPLFNAAYLTEKALQDSKIKQSQHIVGLSKSRTEDLNISHTVDKFPGMSCTSSTVSVTYAVSKKCLTSPIKESHPTFTSKNQLQSNLSSAIDTLADVAAYTARLTPAETMKTSDINTSTENAKFVASEYLKMARNNGGESMEKVDEEISSKPPEVKSNMNVDIENESLKNHNEHDPIASKVVVGAGGVAFKISAKGTEYQSGGYTPGRLMDDGRAVCNVCNKTFSKQSQLRLHINIHYMERPFRCSACAVSFRTKGHLQKHERSGAHLNKVSMTSTFGAATSANPRPFRCSDCNIAFRIHGHLAKHLRSKMHVMKLECSGKLPFGTFAEIERAGVSLTDIDTTDCANSLVSLQLLAQKLHEKDPTKLESWDPSTMVPPLLPEGKESSDEEDNGVDYRTDFNGDNVVRTFTLNNTTEMSGA